MPGYIIFFIFTSKTVTDGYTKISEIMYPFVTGYSEGYTQRV